MPQLSRTRLVSLAAGTIVSTGVGMIPLHRLPRTVRTGYVVLPGLFLTGSLFLALRRGGPRILDDEVEVATGPRIPTVSESALFLALGGIAAGAGAASIRVDRGIEDLLRRRGVPRPRVWMGIASGAFTLAMAVLEARMRTSSDAEQLEERVLELLTAADPMEFTAGQPGGTPADEYQPEAEAISALLLADGTITTAQLDGVWEQWFSEPITPLLGQERVAALAAELISALEALTSPPSAR